LRQGPESPLELALVKLSVVLLPPMGRTTANHSSPVPLPVPQQALDVLPERVNVARINVTDAERS
jgi:hypothetical protein